MNSDRFCHRVNAEEEDGINKCVDSRTKHEVKDMEALDFDTNMKMLRQLIYCLPTYIMDMQRN